MSGTVIEADCIRHDGDLILSDQHIAGTPVIITPAYFRRNERYSVADQRFGISDIERFRQTLRRYSAYMRRNCQFVQDHRDMTSGFLLCGKTLTQMFSLLRIGGPDSGCNMHFPEQMIIPGPLRQSAVVLHIDSPIDGMSA